MRNNVIRHNLFHDLPPNVSGVRLDIGVSGTHIVGNVFLGVRKAAMILGGRDNTVDNNMFINCKPGVYFDAPLLTWGKGYLLSFRARLYDIKHREPLLSERYPRLARILDDMPAVPKGNRIRRNISFGGVWFQFGTPEAEKHLIDSGDNLVGIDPHFLDPQGGNFRLGSETPATEIGFERIPWDMIGPNRTLDSK